MVKGYKVFDADWQCRGKQYTCPGKFEEDVEPCVCESGMHFCKIAANCFNYYDFSPCNKVAEVIAYGDIAEKGNKYCTNKLEIVREIPWTELLEIVNTGKDCTGRGNTGNYNSGNFNSGDCNSGDRNTSNYNSGRENSGHRNTGNYNSGNRNTGDWNKTNYSNGCFNTKEPKIYLFNKPSEWTYADWFCSEAHHLLECVQNNVQWIPYYNMTDAEKEKHPEAEVTCGYLKKIDNFERNIAWWHRLAKYEKEIIKAIPNFDKEIFKEITGIDVDE